MERSDRRIGLLSALPIGVVLVLGFLAPLLVVLAFSFMPPKVFSLAHMPDFSVYADILTQGRTVAQTRGVVLD